MFSRYRFLVLAAALGCGLGTGAQEFKPYPRANITESQWQAYFAEVREKHSANVQDIDDQKLLVFTDKVSSTIYSFTKPGHAAHPSWIARKPEQRGDGIYIGQIGYFAGAEPAFAKLFREYAALNEKLTEDIKRKRLSNETNSHGSNTSANLPMQQVSSSNPEKTWYPTEKQRQAIEAVTKSYFELKDAGKSEQAYAFLSPGQKRYISLPEFTKLLVDFNIKAGAPGGRTQKKVTWYKDAPNSGPGLYVAVDYSSKFENMALHCGYVVWHEQSDGTYLQVREETNMIDSGTMAKLKPEQLDSIRAQYGC